MAIDSHNYICSVFFNLLVPVQISGWRKLTEQDKRTNFLT